VVGAGAEGGYDGDLLCKVRDYASRCVELSAGEVFDVIHAHDWITFPAALAIARDSGRPLVVHVHATEFDRSGELVHQPVYDIERQGMHAATRIIAVSERTKKTVTARYGVSAEKVTVVYNGIEFGRECGSVAVKHEGEKIVLFLGRITMQKGPEFFVRAAARVAQELRDVRFVMAGAGDLLPRVVRLVEDFGLSERVKFAGFLRGEAVDRAYRMADVYVMPSVSEPFGLTALEAARHGVPTIISRSSGVAEVLHRGALNVEFWDVNRMARMILAVLKYPKFAARIKEHGTEEIRKLTWTVAARKCMDVYRKAIADGAPSATGRPEGTDGSRRGAVRR
jgi:glycosyltransferase involved in cell wall biosynthesis